MESEYDADFEGDFFFKDRLIYASELVKNPRNSFHYKSNSSL